ncbi:DUF3742 family protein [Pseudomonas capsici]|uniref:DUF3742 family protein n=1 Tax=Pseudomonas capsici TaxID=2810614 RepID=UPI000E3CADD1|nr:DUF3742 family protein [Pseudomonas capsici]MCV4286472.1 DUF3742 family protein [Pseudomonas capsici]
MSTGGEYESRCQRLGFAFGLIFQSYLKVESKGRYWLEQKGLPRSACKSVAVVIRVLFAATVAYVSFWLACIVLGFWVVKCCLEGSSSVDVDEPVGMDSEKLFPNPYSAQYMNDPAFHDD